MHACDVAHGCDTLTTICSEEGGGSYTCACIEGFIHNAINPLSCTATDMPTSLPTASPTLAPQFNDLYGNACGNVCEEQRVLTIVGADDCPAEAGALPACTSCDITCGDFCASHGECGTNNQYMNNCPGNFDVYLINCISEGGTIGLSASSASVISVPTPSPLSTLKESVRQSANAMQHTPSKSKLAAIGKASKTKLASSSTSRNTHMQANLQHMPSKTKFAAIKPVKMPATSQMIQVQETVSSPASLAMAGGMMCAAGLVVLVAISRQKRRQRGYQNIGEHDQV
jgi:hypothetical protein